MSDIAEQNFVKLMLCLFIIALVEVSIVSTFGETEVLELYVAVDGNDAWSGRVESANEAGIDGPFATFERARDEIRRLRTEGDLPSGGVVVEVAGGRYERDQVFELSAQDSGDADCPISYRGQQGKEVRWTGGRQITSWAQITDEATLSRLAPDARGKVVRANLKALGITDFGEVSGGGVEVFCNDKAMEVSRWPNEGFVKITDIAAEEDVNVRGTKGTKTGRFVYEGDRPSRWTDEKDAWVHGYWFWDWSDQRHKIASIDTAQNILSVEPPYHGYGYRKGQWFYAFNLLIELDTPGQWYLDREEGMLYFWPPSPIEEADVVVSVAQTLIQLDDVSHTTFSGFTFEATRSHAVVVSGGSHTRVVGCTLRNLGAWAVRISGGTQHGVVGCDIYETGHGGIALTGGERTTLIPADHYAENNHIHHYGRWNRMYQPAISLSGVGNRATHNLIHNAPHMAISFSGNDHRLEFNEIHSVCYESNDAGAIYSGRDWTMRGTIIRHNYLHDITGFQGRGCVGVYLDDMFCGTEISGNLFYRVTRAAFIGGGRDCLVENNLFVDCEPALHIDSRAMGWASYHVGTTMKDRLDEMPYKNELWSTRYPALVDIWEDEPAAPKGNVVVRNVSYGGRWDGVQEQARPFVQFDANLIDEDPHFVGTPPSNFALQADSPAYELEFISLPLEEIGLYADENRASWPVQHHVRPVSTGDVE